jgi:hypothetical protein
MLVRLTKSARLRSGWLAALLYLFCVLAPGAALALGDAALCLTIETPAVAHDHEAVLPAHAHHQAAAAHHAHDDAAARHAGHRHGDNGAPNPCCAMLCVSAIAADPPAVVKPLQPISVCVAENFQRLPGEAPPLLYRPPIADPT